MSKMMNFVRHILITLWEQTQYLNSEYSVIEISEKDLSFNIFLGQCCQ